MQKALLAIFVMFIVNLSSSVYAAEITQDQQSKDQPQQGQQHKEHKHQGQQTHNQTDQDGCCP